MAKGGLTTGTNPWRSPAETLIMMDPRFSSLPTFERNECCRSQHTNMDPCLALLTRPPALLFRPRATLLSGWRRAPWRNL